MLVQNSAAQLSQVPDGDTGFLAASFPACPNIPAHDVRTKPVQVDGYSLENAGTAAIVGVS
jgi:hypothetical protein